MTKRKIPWKRLLSLLYIVVTVIVVFIVGATNNRFSQLKEAFKSFDPLWLFIMLLCVAGFYLSENYTLWFYLKAERHDLDFRTSFKVTMIGQYYSALTPFASGGQPLQVYYMKKHGVPVGIGSSAMTVKTMLFNISVVLMGIVGFIINFRHLSDKAPAAVWLGLLGILLNCGIIVLFWLMFFSRSLCEKVIKGIAKLLSKLRIVKDLDRINQRIDSVLSDYFSCVEFIKKHPKKMVYLFFATLFETLCLMSVSFCIFKAFGFADVVHPIMFIGLQYVLFITCSYVPLPGASGAQEFGFLTFFNGIFPEESIFVVMMIWRFFTYFISIIFGGAVVVWETLRGFLPKGADSDSH